MVQNSIGEMPQHYHTAMHWSSPTAQQFGVNYGNYNGAEWSFDYIHAAGNAQPYFVTGYTGNSQLHNNLPPYISVYIFKRIL